MWDGHWGSGCDTRLPAVGAHEEGLVLVEGENAVLLPGLPHAFALRDDRRRGLVGIEHVESDLTGARDDGVHPLGKAADHPNSVGDKRAVNELYRGEPEVGVRGAGAEVHARRGEQSVEGVVPPTEVGLCM